MKYHPWVGISIWFGATGLGLFIFGRGEMAAMIAFVSFAVMLSWSMYGSK
mgnify:CR=1